MQTVFSLLIKDIPQLPFIHSFHKLRQFFCLGTTLDFLLQAFQDSGTFLTFQRQAYSINHKFILASHLVFVSVCDEFEKVLAGLFGGKEDDEGGLIDGALSIAE